MSKFVSIDQDGLLLDFEKQPVADFEETFSLLDSLKLDDNFIVKGTFRGIPAIVEAYSFPLIIKNIEQVKEGHLQAQAQYGYEVTLDLNKIFLDHNDRFIIYDVKGLPSILSDEAQDKLFTMAESFTDEDITLEGK